jgi:hypothetical protein
VRLFLALWLMAFAVQATDLLAVVAPDNCTEDARGPADDGCADACLRCVCCARLPVFVTQQAAASGSVASDAAMPASPARQLRTPDPRAIYHVPKPVLV